MAKVTRCDCDAKTTGHVTCRFRSTGGSEARRWGWRASILGLCASARGCSHRDFFAVLSTWKLRLYPPPRGWRSHKQGAALKEGLGHLGHVLGDALRVTRLWRILAFQVLVKNAKIGAYRDPMVRAFLEVAGFGISRCSLKLKSILG